MNYIYGQTVIQFRIPISEEGTPGSPEITKKFTTQYGENKPKKKEKKTIDIAVQTVEEEYL